MHTVEGKKRGRGLDHFREEGALLNPAPHEPDRYEEEFYRLLALKKSGKRPGELV